MTTYDTIKTDGRSIQIGDMIQTEDGEWVTVRSVARGMPNGTKMIEWDGGWGTLWNKSAYIIQRPRRDDLDLSE